MAIFGTLDILKEQVNYDKFNKAFEYLEKVYKDGTTENSRLRSLPIDAFERIDLDKNTFVLEQVYNSKEREECFFESHRGYIDVQFILEGEEIIEVSNIDNLIVNFSYDESIDLIKYDDNKDKSSIRLTRGDIAIFYPKDGHMPCLQIENSTKVVKTVVKVRV